VTTATRLLFLAILLPGCASTELQEAAILDGSFAPQFELSLGSDRQEVCSPGTVDVVHTLTNLSDYPAWVCRLASHELTLGCHGYVLSSSHPSCESLGVLGAGESVSWKRDLELSEQCRASRELAEEAPELLELIRPCCGSIPLQAKSTLHVVPPGKKWPSRWVVRDLEAEGPSLTVAECGS